MNSSNFEKTAFKGKKVLVVGAGLSGISAVTALIREQAVVTLNDAKDIENLKSLPSHLEFLAAHNVDLVLGRQGEELLSDVDYVVVSPGIPLDIPLLQAAKDRGVTVMDEIELAYRLCPAKILAVTGTNGKTTTTTLLGEMVKNSASKVVVGGNIGIALSEKMADIKENDLVVAELSSFQLEGTILFNPHIAILTNITPDHLDRHHTMENYQAVKELIFANQKTSDFAILNYDDEVVRSIGAKIKSQVVYFSRKEQLKSGIFVSSGNIRLKWQDNDINICKIEDIKIKGAHNIENALAAGVAAFLAGTRPEDIEITLKTFPGVEHRIEPVTSINGVPYYNDSKATNPESAIKALEAFPGNIILLAGGRDKNTGLAEFMSLVKEKVDHLILMGEAKERFAGEAAAYGVKSVIKAETFPQAVDIAHSLAKSPQVVLLSPACASYDMFDNYEERGREFKKLVLNKGGN